MSQEAIFNFFLQKRQRPPKPGAPASQPGPSTPAASAPAAVPEPPAVPGAPQDLPEAPPWPQQRDGPARDAPGPPGERSLPAQASGAETAAPACAAEPAVQEAHTAAPADDVEPLQLAEGLRGVPAPFQLPGAAAPVEDDEEEDSIGASSEGDAVEADAAWDEAGAPLDSVPQPAGAGPAAGAEDRQLTAYGVPEAVAAAYAQRRRIAEMYPWQAECLGQEGVLGGRNLVYCAPTSGGKTLVAEVLLIRRLAADLERDRQQRRGRRRKHAGRGARRLAIVVLPFVAVVAHLRAVLAPLRARVTAFHGGQGGPLLSPRVDVAVCTIEKAAAMVNAYVEAGRLSEVGTVVVDEAHMVGDGDRGPLLELTLTKLLFHDPARSIQVVAMSATLPNVGALARWLGAALYTTDFRPVPLSEFLKIGDTLYSRDMSVARTLRVAPTYPSRDDPDRVMLLVHETVSQGHSVLVFCQSRQACENCARLLARLLPPLPPPGADRAADRLRALRNAVLDELRSLPSGLDETLAFTIPAGVGVHTAGLAADERDAVERGFRSGAISCLAATSTLAAGVNLPARRVLFRSARMGRELLSPAEYRQARHVPPFPFAAADVNFSPLAQMSGRAGRAGADAAGESIVLCKPNERDEVLRIMSAPLPPLDSCLRDPERGLARVLAEAVGSGAVARREDAARFVRCTLLASLDGEQAAGEGAGAALGRLVARRLLERSSGDGDALAPTTLGRAARRGLVLSHDAHLAFLSTPPRAAPEPPDWGLLFRLHAALRGDARRAADLCGVSEAFLCAAARTPPPYGSPERGAVLHRRFFGALALCDLLQERPIGAVAAKFGLARGQLQSLQTSASGFAGAIAGLCDGLNWWQLRLIAARFRDRLAAGVQAELLDLVRVPGVTAARARALHRAGFRTLQALAAAPEKELARRCGASAPRRLRRRARRRPRPKQATLSPEEGEERRAEADALAHLGGEPEGEAEAEEGTPGRTPPARSGRGGARASWRRGGVAGAPREPAGRPAVKRARGAAPASPAAPGRPRALAAPLGGGEGAYGSRATTAPGEWGRTRRPGPARPAPRGRRPSRRRAGARAAEEERRLASAAAAGSSTCRRAPRRPAFSLRASPERRSSPRLPPERWAALAADWRAARAVAIACAFAPPDAEPEDEEEEGEEGAAQADAHRGASAPMRSGARRRRRLERLADPSARAPGPLLGVAFAAAPGRAVFACSARAAPGALRALDAPARRPSPRCSGAPAGLLWAMASRSPPRPRRGGRRRLRAPVCAGGPAAAPSTAAQHVACRRAALALASSAHQRRPPGTLPTPPAAGFGHAEFKLRVLEREAHRLAGRKFDLRSPPPPVPRTPAPLRSDAPQELAAVLLGELRVGEMAAALGVELPRASPTPSPRRPPPLRPLMLAAAAETASLLPRRRTAGSRRAGRPQGLARVHPLPAVLAEHRSLRFHYSSAPYIAPLPRYAEWSDGPAGPERRVHATVVQTHTATGRLALSRPNLHMTPREPFTFAPVRYWTAKSIHEELEEGAEFEDLSERGPDTPANAAWWRDNDFRRVRVNCTSLRQRGAIVRGVLLQVTGESVEEAQIRARAGPGEGGEGEGEGSAGSSGEDEGEEGEGEGGAAPTMSLADYWRVEGYAYTPARAAAVKQVRVRVRVGGVQRVLSYPADQVWRVLSNAMAVTDPSKFRPRPGINVPLSASSSASDPPEEDDALRR
eukprot:tig00021246_g19612.t1